jgi:hypothetical protein
MAGIGVAQLVAACGTDKTRRAIIAVFSFFMWLALIAILIQRQGFSAVHPFAVPLVVANFLAIFILIGRGPHYAGSTDSA